MKQPQVRTIPFRNQPARGFSIFLTEDTGSDLLLSLSKQPAGNPDLQSSEYDDFELWEEENLNLLESGSRWFTALLTGGEYIVKSYTFQDRVENEPVNFQHLCRWQKYIPDSDGGDSQWEWLGNCQVYSLFKSHPVLISHLPIL